jgi:hypothetical protein
MGSSFENILIEAAEPEALRNGLVRSLKAAGFVPSGEGEDADCAFRLYGADGCRFSTLVGESFGGNAHELAAKLARALKRRAIVAWCVDSDALMLSLTKGGAFSAVCVGDPGGYDIEPGPYRAAPWKELVGEAHWAAFRAAVEAKYVCADEALLPLAPLVGYRYEDSVRYPGDPGGPLLECRFRRRVEHPWYLPDDLPPAFDRASHPFRANPIRVSFIGSGGKGKGLQVLVIANGFDPDEYEIDEIRLGWDIQEYRPQQSAAAKPIAYIFDDGSAGWVAEFPDVEIQPGINPKHPDVYTQKGMERHFQRHVNVDFLILGGDFPEPVRTGGRPDFEGGPKEPSVDIYMIPLENREGRMSMRVGVDRPDGDEYPRVPEDKV